MADNEQRKTIRILVDTGGAPGLKALAEQMGNLNKSVKKTSDVLGSFKNVFDSVLGFSIAGIGIKTLADLSDSMQNLTNRIQVFTGDSSETARVFDEITHAADRTKSSISDVAQIYTRLAASTKELKLSSNTLIAITEGLQNAFRLGGSTAKEATNATIQFSQAMALGVLRGQDLKSVLSQSSVLGDVLAKALGRTGQEGTRGALLKFAEAGGLTSSFVLKALIPALSEINKEAEKLTPTFEQSATKAINAFTVAVGELNQVLGLSSGFAKSVDFIIEKAGLLAVALGTVLTGALIFNLIPAIKAVGTALLFLVANPVGIAITAFGLLAAGLVYLFGSFDKFKSFLQDIGVALEKLVLKLRIFISTYTGVLNPSQQYQDDKAREIASFESRITAIETFQEKKKKLNIAEEANEKARQKKLEEAAKKDADRLKNGDEAIVKRSDLLSKLNKQYDSGQVSVSQYYERLESVDAIAARGLFLDGKKDLEQFHSELRKNDLSVWNRQLYDGSITLEEYNKNVENNKLDTLNEKFAAGKINIQEYDAELNKLTTKFSPGSALAQGLQDTVNGIGSLGNAVAGAVTRTFGRLEDALVEFTKKGKVNMNEFAQAVLDDLNRIIIRSQVIAPLAQGLLNFITPGPAAASSVGSYNRFGATATPFASGGIVNGLTPFTYAGGKMGVAGESGPEAIIPLKRGPGGDLGIAGSANNTVVNVINNSGGQVEQSETTGPGGEKQIDIIIHAKVKEGFSRGEYDKQLNSSYGLKRKGS